MPLGTPKLGGELRPQMGTPILGRGHWDATGDPKIGGGTEILMGTPILGEGAPRCQWGPQNWAVGALRPQMGSLILGGGALRCWWGPQNWGGD